MLLVTVSLYISSDLAAPAVSLKGLGDHLQGRLHAVVIRSAQLDHPVQFLGRDRPITVPVSAQNKNILDNDTQPVSETHAVGFP